MYLRGDKIADVYYVIYDIVFISLPLQSVDSEAAWEAAQKQVCVVCGVCTGTGSVCVVSPSLSPCHRSQPVASSGLALLSAGNSLFNFVIIIHFRLKTNY